MKTPTNNNLVYLVSKIFGWWVDDHRPNGTFSTVSKTKKPNDSKKFLVPNLFGFRFGFWLKKIVVENCGGCFVEMGISLGKLKQDIVTCLRFVCNFFLKTQDTVVNGPRTDTKSFEKYM